VGAKA